MTKHTPGPWAVGPVDDTVITHVGPDNVRYEIAAIDGDYNQPETWPVMEANARLIASAPDHADFGRAITTLGARWEPLSSRTGEFCIGGLRYATDLDEFGVPVLHAGIRAAIAKAEGR